MLKSRKEKGAVNTVTSRHGAEIGSGISGRDLPCAESRRPARTDLKGVTHYGGCQRQRQGSIPAQSAPLKHHDDFCDSRREMVVSLLGNFSWVFFNSPTRGPSFPAPGISSPPAVKASPVLGNPPSRCVIQPLAVATLSSCCTGPMIFSRSCKGSVPETSQRFSLRRTNCVASASNSSLI